METDKTRVMSCRVPARLAALIEEVCRLDMHINPADFIRDAIREKVQRDFPELAKKLVTGGGLELENMKRRSLNEL